MKAALQEQYEKEVMAHLKKELGIDNVHALPKLLKVNVNVGIGSLYTSGNKDYSYIEESIMNITGQRPKMIKARKSVSNFKLREGMPNGLSVTLRGKRMYDFIYKLVNIALPRVRDFRGITVKGFDGRGNFSLGLKDVTIFPSVNHDSLSRAHGLQINVCTSAEDSRSAYVLLKALGFPFKDEVK